MDKTQGVKYPRVLADNETTGKKKILDQPELFSENETLAQKINELGKAYFTLSCSHAYIFDGLSLLCRDFYDQEHINLLLKIEKGIEDYIDVIERQNSTSETHYRSVLTLDEAKYIFCGDKYKADWPEVYKDIVNIAYNPLQKKTLVLGKKLYIDTEPIRIDFVYNDGSASKQLANLAPRQSKTQKTMGIKPDKHKKQRTIAGIAIEYYKPLFAPIIEMRKKTPGKAYLLIPQHFQLGLKYVHTGMYENLVTESEKTSLSKEKIQELIAFYGMEEKTKGIYQKTLENLLLAWLNPTAKERAKVIKGISPLEMRRFYLYLALHDNRRGGYITTNLMDMIESCFTDLIDTNREGKKTLYPSRKKELLNTKLPLIFLIFEIMTTLHLMDGGQIVPTGLIATDNEGELRIKCQKSTSIYSKFTSTQAADKVLAATNSVLNITPAKP